MLVTVAATVVVSFGPATEVREKEGREYFDCSATYSGFALMLGKKKRQRTKFTPRLRKRRAWRVLEERGMAGRGEAGSQP